MHFFHRLELVFILFHHKFVLQFLVFGLHLFNLLRQLLKLILLVPRLIILGSIGSIFVVGLLEDFLATFLNILCKLFAFLVVEFILLYSQLVIINVVSILLLHLLSPLLHYLHVILILGH